MIETEAKYFIKLAKEKIGMRDPEPVGEQKYFFIHIPKTAGTSFLFTLYDSFAYRSIFPHFQDYINPNKKSYLPAHEFKKNRDEYITQHTKIVCGHFPFWYKDVIGDDVKTLVFFREPRRRLISDVLYLKHQVPNFADYSFEDILDFRDGVIYRKQAAQFGYKPHKQNMKVVLQRLNNCDFVGITEEFGESIKLCNKIFDWSLVTSVSKNKKKSQDQYKLSGFEHLIQDELLAADYEIYHAALKKYKELKEQNNL